MIPHTPLASPPPQKFLARRTIPGFAATGSAALTVCVLLALLPAAGATEYFVGGGGDDTHDGRSREQAFATIQRGVDALEPGDTLTIGPGMYFENVKREGLGGPDADTTIRAEIPGTAILRGDIEAPAFEKIDGFRFIYGAPLEEAPKAVIDHSNLITLRPKANLAELDFSPGHFFHDAAAGMLYLSNGDLTPPGARRYTLAVSGEAGLDLLNPRRVVIDGLAAAGFFPGWGIQLTSPESCVVRNCVLYLSVGGVVMGGSGSNNLIEGCVSYAHTFGGIVRYGANHDAIRNNRTFRSKTEGTEYFGIMHYNKMQGPILIENNLSWGQNFDFSVKPIGQDRMERNVALGFIRNKPMVHNLVGGGNEYDRSSEASADNILFLREKNLDQDFEFADPLNLDYRLQPDSRFRGTAPDGSDRGPFPYQANIYYLSPEGDDSADGLSMRAPWRSLQRGLATLKPGDTLYLAAGAYPAVDWSGAGDGKEPIRILGRGRGETVITGPVRFANLDGVEWERLGFDGEVTVQSSNRLRFQNCSFYGTDGGLNLEEATDATLTHCVFVETSLDLQACERVRLQGNLFANPQQPAVRLDSADAILHSDFNSYQNGELCWEVGGSAATEAPQGFLQRLLAKLRKPAAGASAGERWTFEDLRRSHDANSRVLTPEFLAEAGLPRLANPEIFEGRGPHSTGIGIYHEYQAETDQMVLIGPFLHSVGDTTANIEWWSSHPATFHLAWGETPETENVVRGVKGTERFNTFSLTGLEPGKKYYFRIQSAAATPQAGIAPPPELAPADEPLAFVTAATAAPPKAFYVAPDGNDANPGTSRDQALRTVNRAAALVGPGDTILLAGGEYRETVRARAAGAPGRPITFRALPGEQPRFLGTDLALAFDLTYKPHYRFEGLYFDFDPSQRVIVLRESPGVEIERCFRVMISADASPGLVVRNCVLRGGWQALSIGRSPGVVIENNVFSSTVLQQLQVGADSLPVRIRRNIFFDNQRNKTNQTLLMLPAEVDESDNCFHFRWPEDEKLLINDRTLPEIRARRPTNALAANPMMPGAGGQSQGWPRTGGEDFDAFFTAHPELILRDTGLQRSAFAEYPFHQAPWPYDQEWARKILAAKDGADTLAGQGNAAAALAAYLAIKDGFPLPKLLESQILDAASRCAEQLGNWEQAAELAGAIPLPPISIRRQMQILLARGQYAELVETFSQAKMGGSAFHLSFEYPESEELMEELFLLRATAHQKLGNSEAAEADLRIMNDKRQQLGYRSGESIHDRVALRLGNFYRDVLGDEARALEAYSHVVDRTTWDTYLRQLKPAVRGADQTLVDATKAAAEILRKGGKEAEARQLEWNLVLAQAEANAAVLDYPPMLERFRELLAAPGKTTDAMTANLRRLLALPEPDRTTTLQAIAALTNGIRPDTRAALVDRANSGAPAERETAVLGLLLFIPAQEQVSAMLEKLALLEKFDSEQIGGDWERRFAESIAKLKPQTNPAP